MAWGTFAKILDGVSKVAGIAAPIVSTLIPGAAPIVDAATGLIGAISGATKPKTYAPPLTGQKSIALTRHTPSMVTDSDDSDGLLDTHRMLGANGHGIRNPKIRLV